MSNTNENPTSYLPEEVIMINILPKLPIKSLLRFKSVNKEWNSFISSLYFGRLRINQSSSNNHILINHKTCFISFDYENFEEHHENGDDGVEKTHNISFNDEGDIISTNKNCVARILKSEFHSPNYNIHAIGSCNGLVCLLNQKRSNSLYLWNPTTLARREIPYPNPNPNPNTNPNGKRAKSERLDAIWGFGYVSLSTNDYKIVRLYRNKSNNNVVEIQIFSKMKNNWKSLHEYDDSWDFRELNERIGTYADNVIYWTFQKKYILYEPCEWYIIGFDLVAEKLIKLPFPESAVKLSTGFILPPLLFGTMDGTLGASWYIGHPKIVLYYSNEGEIGTFVKDEGIGKWINANRPPNNLIQCHKILGMTNKDRFILYAHELTREQLHGPEYETLNIKFIKFIDDDRNFVTDLKLKIPPSRNIISYVQTLVSPFH